MSRQYTQKHSPAVPWNWTDQRVQQIMKKYEQPAPSPRCGDRTPLRNRNSNQPEDQRSSGKSPWKPNYEKSNYYCNPPRQDCGTPQNKTFDLSSKENSYQRSDARSNYGQGVEGRGSKRRQIPYDEAPSIYDCTPTRKDYTPSRKDYGPSRDEELLDAKNYLREQERKYLKIDLPQESNWRQREHGSRREREETNWRERENETWKDRQPANWKQRERDRERESQRDYKLKTECAQPSRTKQYSRMDPFKDVEYEPRINNIERINNKIKKILESVQEDREKGHESTTVELKPTPNQQFTSKKPQVTKETSIWREQRKIEQRSKSCLSLKKNLLPACELSQKVNDQLARFSNKITEFEEQKRKLNISFKPSEPQKQERTNAVQSTANARTAPRNDLEDMSPLSPLSPLTNTQQEDPQSAAEGEVSPNFHSPYIGLKELDSRDDSLCVEGQEQVQQIARNMELRRQKREQAERPPQQVVAGETGRLMAMLSEQVQLDEQLQLAKKWFARCAKQADWALLQELLAQRWREMTLEEIQAEFAITLEEEDPFYSYRPEQFEVEDLVANYIICCRHWCEKVEGQWCGGRLREQGCFRRLDREGRGEAGVQDLVREINVSEDVFYRNRNLYLVLQRLTHHGSARLTEDRLYSAFSKK